MSSLFHFFLLPHPYKTIRSRAIMSQHSPTTTISVFPFANRLVVVFFCSLLFFLFGDIHPSFLYRRKKIYRSVRKRSDFDRSECSSALVSPRLKITQRKDFQLCQSISFNVDKESGNRRHTKVNVARLSFWIATNQIYFHDFLFLFSTRNCFRTKWNSKQKEFDRN